MELILDENIAKIDLTPLKEYLLGGFHWNRDCTPEDDFTNMNQEPGIVPYKLYAHLSKNFKRVADLGTFYGHSALACSLDLNTQVTTYDINSKNLGIKEKENITVVEGDIFDYIDDILEHDLIILDIDPHDGIQEARFTDILKQEKYEGVIIADDIHLQRSQGMISWWNNLICTYKKDITAYGASHGTGIFKI